MVVTERHDMNQKYRKKHVTWKSIWSATNQPEFWLPQIGIIQSIINTPNLSVYEAHLSTESIFAFPTSQPHLTNLFTAKGAVKGQKL